VATQARRSILGFGPTVQELGDFLGAKGYARQSVLRGVRQLRREGLADLLGDELVLTQHGEAELS